MRHGRGDHAKLSLGSLAFQGGPEHVSSTNNKRATDIYVGSEKAEEKEEKEEKEKKEKQQQQQQDGFLLFLLWISIISIISMCCRLTFGKATAARGFADQSSLNKKFAHYCPLLAREISAS